MATKLVGDALSVALIACALTVTGFVVRKELFQPEPNGPNSAIELSREQIEDAHRGGRLLGDSTATILLVEFSDFQCPYCGLAHQTFERLSRKYPNKIAILARHFPLPSHPQAFAAAVAAECAAAQGRFQEFRDYLFAHQDSIDHLPLRVLSSRAGVQDLVAFEICLSQEEIRDRVNEDLAAGRRIGVTGTPSYVVDGTLYTGIPTEPELEKWIRSRR